MLSTNVILLLAGGVVAGIIGVFVVCVFPAIYRYKNRSSDTIKWIMATYAIITQICGDDYTLYGGMDVTKESRKEMKKYLFDWWNVTNKQNAISQVDWVINEGHRKYFIDTIHKMQEWGIEEWDSDFDTRVEMLEDCLIGEDEDPKKAVTYAYAYDIFEKFGRKAIDAWDYSRALSLYSFYYAAGYMTRKEALNYSLDLARTIQGQFYSWDHFCESYFRGYIFWAEDGASERRATYQFLKEQADNPYEINYYTKLERTW